jgi:hypothetical protein
MLNTTLYGIVVVPAILGVVQVVKQAGLPGKLSPIAALLLGLLAGLGQAATGHLDWPTAIAAGVALGLSASGLYSGAVAVTTPAAAPIPQTAAPIAGPAMKKTTTTTRNRGKFTKTMVLPDIQPPAGGNPPRDGSPPTP